MLHVVFRDGWGFWGLPGGWLTLQGWRQKPWLLYQAPERGCHVRIERKKERRSKETKVPGKCVFCLFHRSGAKPLFTNSVVYTKAKGTLSFERFL